ncbi:type II secretion system protein N [Rheinheimera sp.]|uniref:type II secretion system protein N n=1 Tax=Rheinheimera sp. TaxID=1869214 RepID=UPI00307D6E66
MKKIKTGLVILALYLGFVLLLSPAALWLKLVPLPASVQLGPVSGTVWQGQVQALSVQGLTLSDLKWQLNPWLLFTGKLALTLEAGQPRQTQLPSLKTELRFGFDSMQVRQLQARLPVSLLQPALQLPLPVGLDGAVLLKIPQLEWSTAGCQQLQGLVSWLDAKVQPPTGWIGLGTLDGQLSCADNQLQLVTQPSPPLHLEVTALVSPAGRYRLDGFIKPDSSMPQDVHQAMQFVGKADAQGRFPVRLGSR